MRDKPDFCNEDTLEEYLDFLYDLRESGCVNMFGSSLYLEEEYPELNRKQAKEVVLYWMDTFKERN